MANPNIVNVSLIRGQKSVKKSVTNSPTRLLVNDVSTNELLKVNSILVSNPSAELTQLFTLEIVRSSIPYKIVSNISIPPLSSFSSLTKNLSIYLEEGDTLRAYTNIPVVTTLDVTCSYEQIATSAVTERNDIYANDTSFLVASGGTESTIGNYKFHTFTSNGTFTVSSLGGSQGDVDYLIVGGGGGGGETIGGGGGGGAVRIGSVRIGTGTYPVVVGAGGNGAISFQNGVHPGGNSGANSIVFGIVAYGGGGGGGYNTLGLGHVGGAGGGGGAATGGNGVPNAMGYPGGLTNNNTNSGMGGGGAGTPGRQGSSGTPGRGGAGIATNFTGQMIVFGGGGGGGARDPSGGSAVGTGGLGGGGDGGTGAANGANGVVNTGGGGGGGGYRNSPVFEGGGGNGGSGIVVIRYPLSIEVLPTYTLDLPHRANNILHLDANNPLSYSGSGTVWTDLSGNGYHFNILATAFNRTEPVKFMDFKGSFAIAKSQTDIPLTDATGVTYICVTRILNSSADWRTLTRSYAGDHHVMVQSGGWNMGYYDNDTNVFVSTGYSQQSLPNYASANWIVLYVRYQSVSPFYQLSFNDTPGTIRGSLTTANGRYTRGFGYLGGNGTTPVVPATATNNQYWGDIAQFLVYNKFLSDAELLDIFNRIRGRYGL
jgi:hypothetical protein